MTLIAYGYGPISLAEVLTELQTSNPGRSYPIALGDTDVRALAGIPDGPISLTDLYGKSAIAALTATGYNDSGHETTVSRSGSVSAYPSVTYTGGAGTKSFQWIILSSTVPVTLINPTNAQCEVRKDFGQNSTGHSITYLRCIVSDSTGSVTVDNIIAELTWSGNL